MLLLEASVKAISLPTNHRVGRKIGTAVGTTDIIKAFIISTVETQWRETKTSDRWSSGVTKPPEGTTKSPKETIQWETETGHHIILNIGLKQRLMTDSPNHHSLLQNAGQSHLPSKTALCTWWKEARHKAVYQGQANKVGAEAFCACWQKWLHWWLQALLEHVKVSIREETHF